MRARWSGLTVRPAWGSQRLNSSVLASSSENASRLMKCVRRELASLEFGIRLAGRIVLGPVGQTGHHELHMGRQRSNRYPVQQPCRRPYRQAGRGRPETGSAVARPWPP